MKATGIVRRIDDLGCVVIPKEISRVLRIRDGEAYYIGTTLYYLDEDKVSTGSYQVFVELEE